MWGRMETCGRLAIGYASRRPVNNRPQDSILPHYRAVSLRCKPRQLITPSHSEK